MTRFHSLALLALLLGLCFGCQKDDLVLEKPDDSREDHFHEDHSLKDDVQVYASLQELKDDHPQASNSIKELLSKMNTDKNGDLLTIGEIIVTPNEYSGHTFVGFLDAFNGAVYKLINKTNATGILIENGVVEIRFDAQFEQDHQRGSARLEDFQGTISVITVDEFDSIRSGSGTLDDCWRIVFGGGTSGGSNDNGGSYPGGPISPGGTGTNSDSWPDDLRPGCTLVSYVACGCDPHHPGGRYGNPICNCKKPDIFGYEVICPLQSDPDGQEDYTSSPEEKDTYWDCVSRLAGAGLITDNDLFKKRLLECEGLGSIYDTGDNPTLNHPDTEFCTPWKDYMNRCLSQQPFRDVIELWSQLLFLDQNTFEHIIANDQACSGDGVAALLTEFPDLSLSRPQIDILLNEPGFLDMLDQILQAEGNQQDLFQIADLMLTQIHGQPVLSLEDLGSIIEFWNDRDEIDIEAELIDLVNVFVKLKKTDGDYKFQRLAELYNLLQENPDAFVEDCQDGYGIEYWADLASFTIPSECQLRLDDIGWDDQDILEGNSKTVNLDRHSVLIRELPDLNGDGVATQEELFDRIRLDFPEFANGATTVVLNNLPDYNVNWQWNFYASDYNDIWNTPEPVSTIIDIDVSPEGVLDLWGITDDATVICSQFDDDCCWVFSTIATGHFQEPYNGTHPVSGNRQFGITQLSNGNFEFYTRAADRGKLASVLHPLAYLTGNDMATVFYAITDDTWNNLMDNLTEMINDNGGDAVKNIPVIKRPDWEAVRGLLRSSAPLTSIPCD